MCQTINVITNMKRGVSANKRILKKDILSVGKESS
jgi:hypothetical protein